MSTSEVCQQHEGRGLHILRGRIGGHRDLAASAARVVGNEPIRPFAVARQQNDLLGDAEWWLLLRLAPSGHYAIQPDGLRGGTTGIAAGTTRGRGLGRAMLGSALDVLSGLGARKAILYVDDDAPPGDERDRAAANALYESAGFAEVDRLYSYSTRSA